MATSDRLSEISRELSVFAQDEVLYAEREPAELPQMPLRGATMAADVAGRADGTFMPAGGPRLVTEPMQGTELPDAGDLTASEMTGGAGRRRIGQILLDAVAVVLESLIEAEQAAEDTLASLQARKARRFNRTIAPRGSLEYRNLMCAVLGRMMQILEASRNLRDINAEIRSELMIRPASAKAA